MVDPSPILVTGATGNVGRHVASELLAMGRPVRALVRDPSRAGLPLGTEVVRGDLSKSKSLSAALEGIDSVFLVWPFPTSKTASSLLTELAKRASRVVYLSSMSVRDDLAQQVDPISALHADIERLIRDSGMKWTFLRPSGFATNTRVWAPQIRRGDLVRWPYGAALRPLIDERDIGAVAAHILAEYGHDDARYLLSGPNLLTQVEQLQIIAEVLGRDLTYEDAPARMARQHLLTSWGMPAAVARLLPRRARARQLADGALMAWKEMIDVPEQVTSTVQDIIGAPARTFTQWVSDHAADFI